MNDLPIIEFDNDDADVDGAEFRAAPRARAGVVPYLVVAALGLLAGWWLFGGDPGDEPEPVREPVEQLTEEPDVVAADRLAATRLARTVPPELLAAELYLAQPSAANARALYEAIGQLGGIAVATAVGSFDAVSFDPADPDRLLAVRRSGYGPASNQSVNQLWAIDDGRVSQQLWAPGTDHDHAGFDADGTVTMWVHGGEPGFAPRTAVVFAAGSEMARTPSVFASRSVTAGGRVFALTGDGDYYSNVDSHQEVVALGSAGAIVLADGGAYEWIDRPMPGVVVAYPATSDASTMVWDSATLEPMPRHVLAGLRYRRIAVSGDGSTALGVRFDGSVDVIDLETRGIVADFADLDPTGIDRPVTLNEDGSIAVTVDHGGHVGVWAVPDRTPIARFEADAGPLRWLPERLGPRAASAVSPDARRVALRMRPQAGTPAEWLVIDTDPAAWVARACLLAGRGLTPHERTTLGLDDAPEACPQR